MKIINLKKRILLGVYFICCLRKLKKPLVTEFLAFGVLALALSYFVSVPSVWSNMLSSENFYRYFMTAFSSTDILVKSLLVLVGVTMLISAREVTVLVASRERFA